jgi:hypothetical protein
MNAAGSEKQPAVGVRPIDILNTYWFIEAFLVYVLR